jgi:RNA polymerase sigma-70 factor (ECF subfamily)
MDAEDDSELMHRVAAGDKAAFGILFDRYQKSVMRFAYRFVGEKGRAEELAQDIFVKLFQSAHRYQATAKFKTFLFRVAANHCLNEMRRGEYRMPHLSDEGASPIDSIRSNSAHPDDVLAGKEVERAVNEALAQMSPRERAAFTMCRFEGMAYREIAESLEASEGAVKSLIHRATLSVARKIEQAQAEMTAARSRV